MIGGSMAPRPIVAISLQEGKKERKKEKLLLTLEGRKEWKTVEARLPGCVLKKRNCIQSSNVYSFFPVEISFFSFPLILKCSPHFIMVYTWLLMSFFFISRTEDLLILNPFYLFFLAASAAYMSRPIVIAPS